MLWPMDLHGLESLRPLVAPRCARNATAQGRRDSKSCRSLGLVIYIIVYSWDGTTLDTSSHLLPLLHAGIIVWILVVFFCILVF